MRPAVRLAAIMQTKVAFVWTHDSVGVGEDGPTHQPVEQLASLRAMPGLRVIRPADANEVAAAWRVHLDGDGPTALLLHPPEGRRCSRARRSGPRAGAAARRVHARRRRRGSRPTSCSSGPAPRSRSRSRRATTLVERGLVGARRVDAVVGPASRSSPTSTARRCCRPIVPTLAVEAGVRFGWERYADDVVSIDRFGASAPGDVVLRELGITPEHVVERALALLGVQPAIRRRHAMASSIKRLIEFGQSPWYDNLTRALATGGLRTLVDEHGIRGVTSNPTIFEKAMASGNDYDAQLREVTAAGASTARRVLGSRHDRHRARGRHPAPALRRVGRPRRLRVGRGLARSRARHRRHDRAGQGAVGAPRPPQRDDQDPRDRRGHPRDRGRARRRASTSTSR